MKTVVALLLSAFLCSGCSSFSKTGRYERYVRKMSRARDAERERMQKKDLEAQREQIEATPEADTSVSTSVQSAE